MANEGLKYNHYDYTRIFVDPPSLVQGILLANEMGTSYVRRKTIPNISYSGWDVALNTPILFYLNYSMMYSHGENQGNLPT